MIYRRPKVRTCEDRRAKPLILILAVALLALAGCGGDDEGSSGGGGQETATVKVGVLPISNVAPLYLGIEKGFFREEGIEVEPSVAQSGNEIATALVSGDLQFAFLGYVPAASAASRGLPLKLVANADNGAETAEEEWTQIMVSEDSPIREPKDLAGQTIAVNALKGVGEVVIKAALEKPASRRRTSSCWRSRSRRWPRRWRRTAWTRSGRPSPS